MKFTSALAYTSIAGTICQAQLNNVTTPNLNLTTIAGVNGSSALQCWQISEFMTSAVPGVSGSLNLNLGNTSNASYTIIPPRFNGGVHNAPANQYVHASSSPPYSFEPELFSTCLIVFS